METTCQITYLPLFTEQVIDEVDSAIDFINTFDVETSVNDLSTTVKGERDEVLKLVGELYRYMDDRNKKFRLHIELLSSKGYS